MRPNARIEDVLHALAGPEEYVRGIVDNFLSYQFDRDSAVIRLGISGKGIAPHYSIEQGSTTVTFSFGTGSMYERREVFHGKSHNPILEDQWKGISWSSAPMSFSEVQTVLGHLRASKKMN